MSIAHASRKWKRLLDYLPDEVVLDMAGREFHMYNAQKCMCGWALRVLLSTVLNKTAARVLSQDIEGETVLGREFMSVPKHLALLVGGDQRKWANLFFRAADDATLPEIEYAFTQRVQEAAERVGV